MAEGEQPPGSAAGGVEAAGPTKGLAAYRRHAAGSLVLIALLVGAFASGLEVRLSIGPRSSSAQEIAAGQQMPASSPGAVEPGSSGVIPSVPGSAPLIPVPQSSVAGITDAGRNPAGTPAPAPPTAGATPKVAPTPPDEDRRCLVTDTLVLAPIESEDVPGEACEDVTEAHDEVRAPDIDPPAPGGGS